MSLKKSLLTALVAHLCLVAQLHADMTAYGFKNITANNVNSAAIGEAQLSVQVNDVLGHTDQALFKFLNTGPEPCSITAAYFDDGALLGIAQLTSSSGVKFSEGANPPNLPGGNTVNFQVTKGFLADSDPPTQPNGVNPGEWLSVLFNLENGMTYNDVINAITLGLTQGAVDGSLRIGIHVQGYEGGLSESYVNCNVPAPAAVTLGMIGLGFIGVLQRRWIVS